MTKRIRVNINLPFSGFYGSTWGDLLDREETQWIEYEEDEREDGERAHPPELRLDGGELVDLLMSHADYWKAQQQFAADYVGAFNTWASDLLGLPLGLTFEALISPRFYNFETDRVFADVDLKVMRELFRRSKAEGHKTLRAVVSDRFTGYDGFIPFYPNDLEVWLRKPLRDWDHNELGTLLVAALHGAGADFRQMDSELMDTDYLYEDAYRAWESAVNWTAFEAARDDARADKLNALRDTDPDRAAQIAPDPEGVPCVRCPNTLDLFDNRPGA